MKQTTWMVLLGWPALLGMFFFLAACHGPVQDHAVEPPVTALPASAAPTPVTPLSANNLTQGVPRTLTYDTSASPLPLVVVQDEMPTCHCAGKTWWVRYYNGNAGTTPDREVRLVIDVNGYVSEAEEIDRTDKVEVVFTPPLALIPDKLPMRSQGDAGFEQTVKMVVHPLGDRSKVRMSGQAHNVIQYVGDERITTGAGTFVARKLESAFTADLSPSKTVDSTEQWFVDGVGVVCERDHETTKVLGATVREKAATILLKSVDASK